MKPAQLIINGVALPFTSNDKYQAYLEPISESLRMASGRLVTEESAVIWKISYQYDKMPDALMATLLQMLRSYNELDVTFLAPGDDIELQRVMQCTKWPTPSIKFFNEKGVRWHTMDFLLESVEGEDDA